MKLPAQQKPPLGAGLISSHPLARGLVGAWLFNEGAGTTAMDSSGYGLHGAFAGATLPTWAVNDYGTPAILCAAGAQSVDLGNVSAFNSSSQWSLACRWSNRAFSSTQYMITKGTNSATRFVVLGTNTGSLYVYMQGTANYATLASFSSLCPVNTWHGFALVYDGSLAAASRLTLYIDGSPVAWDSIAGTIPASMPPEIATENLFIGRSSSASLTAYMSHVYAYNRAMSASDVAALYAEPYAMYGDPAARRVKQFGVAAVR